MQYCPFCHKPNHMGEVFGDHRDWCNDCREVEVTLRWDVTKLSDAQRKLLHTIGRALGWLGVRFDSGGSVDVFDWEWDWSLRGPVKVLFRRYVRDDDRNRYVREGHDSVNLQQREASLEALETAHEELLRQEKKSS